jgi:hypothetical protein
MAVGNWEILRNFEIFGRGEGRGENWHRILAAVRNMESPYAKLFQCARKDPGLGCVEKVPKLTGFDGFEETIYQWVFTFGFVTTNYFAPCSSVLYSIFSALPANW